jgi:sulfur carrier protein ThiS
LRCKQIALGRFGTALWVQPRDRFATGLLADVPDYLNPPASRRNETLVAAVFPGSLNPSSRGRRDKEQGGGESVADVLDELGGSEEEVVVAGRNIFENAPGSSWTSFDYDEVGGRVALGSSFGKVTILQL